MKLSFDNRDHQDLTLCESLYIGQYFENFDITPFAEMVRDNIELTDGMRLFIHDVMTGKIRRPRGAKSKTFSRDLEIHAEIEDLIELGGKNLTSNASNDGAAAIVADKYGIKEDAAVKAYDRINKAINYSRKIESEELN